MADFFVLLKQRKLVQWALAYLAAAWVVLQVLGLVADSFQWPRLVMQAAMAVTALGFVIALLLAWYHGEQGRQRASGTELLLIALVLALGVGLMWRFARTPVTPPSATTPATFAPANSTSPPMPEAVPAKSIAVLPFENLSDDKQNSFFAIGIQDQIITGLSRLDGVKVISRTSTERYAKPAGNIVQIAHELGVVHILEGSVQRAGQRVRINVQLIDALSAKNLWAETYDRTLDDIFQVEDEVAGKIAQSLAARLPGGANGALVARPTSSTAAYDAYIKARIEFATADNSWAKFQKVIAGYRQALALDADFTLALSELVTAEVQAYWYGYDKDGSLLTDARSNLERASHLAPRTAPVLAARGVYTYYVEQDFAKALTIMRQALTLLPGDSRLWFFTSLLERRLGQWDASIADNEHARNLNPNDADVSWSLAASLIAVRQFARSLAVTDVSLAVEPGNPDLLYIKQWAAWQMGGLQAGARALESADPALPQVQAMLGEQALLTRDYSSAANHYRRALGAVATGHESLLTDMVFGNLPSSVPWTLRLALAEQRRGNDAQARQLYGDIEARSRAELAARPVNAHVAAAWHGAQGMALAGLGREDEAVAAVNRAIAMIPSSKDRLDGPSWLDALAKIYSLCGDRAHAIALLEQQLATRGSLITTAMMQLDPVWDPIRNDSRFEVLLQKYAHDNPAIVSGAVLPDSRNVAH